MGRVFGISVCACAFAPDAWGFYAAASGPPVAVVLALCNVAWAAAWTPPPRSAITLRQNPLRSSMVCSFATLGVLGKGLFRFARQCPIICLPFWLLCPLQSNIACALPLAMCVAAVVGWGFHTRKICVLLVLARLSVSSVDALRQVPAPVSNRQRQKVVGAFGEHCASGSQRPPLLHRGDCRSDFFCCVSRPWSSVPCLRAFYLRLQLWPSTFISFVLCECPSVASIFGTAAWRRDSMACYAPLRYEVLISRNAYWVYWFLLG